MSIFIEFDNFSLYVFIFSCFYYLIYKIIIEICISIRALDLRTGFYIYVMCLSYIKKTQIKVCFVYRLFCHI